MDVELKTLFARYQRPFEKSRPSLCWIIFEMLRPPAGREDPVDWEIQERSEAKLQLRSPVLAPASLSVQRRNSALALTPPKPKPLEIA
jgi:hypothetical protein